MAEQVRPKPMPVTSMPDRCDDNQKDFGKDGNALKAGIKGEQKNWNPGR